MLESLVRASAAHGVFVLRSDLIPAETRALLMALARVVLLAGRGSLADQLDRVQAPRRLAPPRHRARTAELAAAPAAPPASPALQFFNGLGGFSNDGREYVTVLGPGQSTPAPWINVISNPSFGFQVAADGTGYTWSENSRDNQLTAWSNDPVADRPGEAFYVRDLDSDELWAPTARPARDPQATYVARHGRG